MKAKEVLKYLVKDNDLVIDELGYFYELTDCLNELRNSENDEDLTFKTYIGLMPKLEGLEDLLKQRTGALWLGEEKQKKEYLIRFQLAYDDTISAVLYFNSEIERMENEDGRKVANL